MGELVRGLVEGGRYWWPPAADDGSSVGRWEKDFPPVRIGMNPSATARWESSLRL